MNQFVEPPDETIIIEQSASRAVVDEALQNAQRFAQNYLQQQTEQQRGNHNLFELFK